jgi:heme exporter protein D
MNWGSFGDFLHMGGYGPYVWGSYGMCMGLVAIEILLLRGRRGRAVAEVRQTIARQAMTRGEA